MCKTESKNGLKTPLTYLALGCQPMRSRLREKLCQGGQMALTLACLLERAFARSISLSGDVGDAVIQKTRSFNNHHLYVRERETEISKLLACKG